MGREVKRVALDFEWPIGGLWSGYLNPHYSEHRTCPFCEGSGYNAETYKIERAFYDHDGGRTPGVHSKRWCDKITQDEVDALVAAGRLPRWNGETRRWDSVPRTAEEVNAANARPRMLGELDHDAINRGILVETRAKRLGVYGRCEACGGDGSLWRTPQARAAAEAWTRTDPPAGDGWQLWSTTSEGHPVSPVFATAEALARWLADTGASSFGNDTATYEQWLAMCRSGWAPSFAESGGTIQSGVAFVAGTTASKEA